MSAIEILGLRAGYGDHLVLNDLNLSVEAGESIAVLGPNGSGKTTLLKVLLGLLKPVAGSVLVEGTAPKPRNRVVGYIPQHRGFDRDLPIRGRDLVMLGLNGHHFGLLKSTKAERVLVDRALEQVGALDYADAPIGMLSGGEQQRLRIAQAILGEPSVLLCDEPLLALDPGRQSEVTRTIDRYRREHGATVLFVTHEINPVLPYIDRILYFVEGRSVLGTPGEVLNRKTLSGLYGNPVEVVNVGGRVIVLAGDEESHSEIDGHHHHDHGEEKPTWI